jgi:hypothetical protein
MENVNVKFNVYDFIDGGVDFGFFVGANLEGLTINGEEDAQNDEINELFAEFGITINFKDIVLLNGGYVDSWEHRTLGTIDEYFFKNKDDAEFVAKTLQNLIDTILAVA